MFSKVSSFTDILRTRNLNDNQLKLRPIFDLLNVSELSNVHEIRQNVAIDFSLSFLKYVCDEIQIYEWQLPSIV